MRLILIASCVVFTVGCVHTIKGTLGKGVFKIYAPSSCYDVDAKGNRYAINTHFPVVNRVCKESK